ncbi:MAG: undecaprenyldiphospho-muramoylpentapeptide beta-N-acetylglucosaminyltransferase [Balneolaceae bacterium]|nr:undecaprenyldiphospho-muramoylpentapeptide beta-N-acetylglucosaminyltransferase [Balneolaceae bacterium]
MHSSTTDISSHSGPATAAMGEIKVLIAAGGTGGHVYPAIAIADALREISPDADILFVGTKKHMEWEAVPKAGYDIKSIWISGFHRRFTLKNLLFPVKLLSSMTQSFAILSDFDPHVVISCGGYAAGPIGWVATKRGIPLVIQEQNSFPGVTNRLLAKNAAMIFTAFKEAENYLPKEKITLAGNPTRKTLVKTDYEDSCNHFDFLNDKETLLILGGSGGAKAINEAISANIDFLHNELKLQIIWQCGPRYYDELHTNLHTDKYENLRLVDFIYDMPKAYAVADLVVSRAGALSCSELALTGKPSILIPSPNVAGDHQTKNAQSMVEEGAAELIKDADAKDTLGGLIEKLIFDQQKLKDMQQAALKLAKPKAADEIAKRIFELANEQVN